MSGKYPTLNKKEPPTPCWSYAKWHCANYCPFKKHICQFCLSRLHKNIFCGSQRDKTATTKKNASNSRDRYNWKNPVYHQKSNVNSVFAVFNVDFESHTKYITFCINKYPVRFHILLDSGWCNVQKCFQWIMPCLEKL